MDVLAFASDSRMFGITFVFDHVSPRETFDAACVRFASHGNVGFTFDLSKANAGEYFQLLKMNTLFFNGRSNLPR